MKDYVITGEQEKLQAVSEDFEEKYLPSHIDALYIKTDMELEELQKRYPEVEINEQNQYRTQQLGE